MHGCTKAIKTFNKQFPKLTEGTVRPWVKTYRESLQNRIQPADIQMSRRLGRPLSLPQELDSKLQKFLVNLREAGGGVNRHVVSGVLLGLIKSDMARYGTYVDFVVTRVRTKATGVMKRKPFVYSRKLSVLVFTKERRI